MLVKSSIRYGGEAVEQKLGSSFWLYGPNSTSPSSRMSRSKRKVREESRRGNGEDTASPAQATVSQPSFGANSLNLINRRDIPDLEAAPDMLCGTAPNRCLNLLGGALKRDCSIERKSSR